MLQSSPTKMLQSSPTIIITFSRPQIYFFIVTRCLKVSVIIANILMFLIGTAHIKKFFKCTPTAKKICFIRQFYFRAEKVILFARNRLRALIVLIFAHDMQIQVAHALCKQGCHLISYSADIRLVTIATCYNCPRSPLQYRYHNFKRLRNIIICCHSIAVLIRMSQICHNVHNVTHRVHTRC